MSEWRLETGSEWTARDPFGEIKPADQSERAAATADGATLRAARNGYASFRVWATGEGEYRLAVEIDAPLEADLYRAWYHRIPKDDGERWITDALVPVEQPAAHQLPDPDNAVEGQTCQEYWVDVFVPRDAPVGTVSGRVRLNDSVECPIRIDVTEAVISDDDALIMNRHSYGCRWLWRQYPGTFDGLDGEARWEKSSELLHQVYRLNYEHRSLLTNRGVGHANTFDPIYGPTLEGHGREKRIVDWTLFDRHHAPLLDGTTFETAAPGAPRPRRPARPLWCVATPMSSEWPADYLYWGQPGYEVEFVNCVRQFDQHFREKGWTTTHPYFFFVHKKRYRWMEWDGDEPKDAKDHKYFIEMDRLFREAIGDTPVPWLNRIDASWQMKAEFDCLEGMVDWWVCGGFLQWYPEEVQAVIERGEPIWRYSGPPSIEAASSASLEHVWRSWACGLDGHCYWNAFDSGPDPWFNSTGNATQLFYPGERFGIPGPIPSVRLKLERNGVQDVNLLAARPGAVKDGLVDAAPIQLWKTPPRVVHELPPEEWDSRNLAASQDDEMQSVQEVDPQWWADIRIAALEGSN
jgi:hypothetical protein